MTSGTLRRVQPAHKSKKVTVVQARNAWLKVEDRSARGTGVHPASTAGSAKSSSGERTGG